MRLAPPPAHAAHYQAGLHSDSKCKGSAATATHRAHGPSNWQGKQHPTATSALGHTLHSRFSPASDSTVAQGRFTRRMAGPTRPAAHTGTAGAGRARAPRRSRSGRWTAAARNHSPLPSLDPLHDLHNVCAAGRGWRQHSMSPQASPPRPWQGRKAASERRSPRPLLPRRAPSSASKWSFPTFCGRCFTDCPHTSAYLHGAWRQAREQGLKGAAAWAPSAPRRPMHCRRGSTLGPCYPTPPPLAPHGPRPCSWLT